ncbi:AMP-binding protein [Sphingomonas turrisvirgatae]|uniref:ATP-dependent acyl-CoA ligase n=1 Tax=Sphingomonas turrisvirgatae TaxID=1888892 RepID=A0A1E3LXH7_9SPHN|nr:AMP-binding protein [Sphingomonas turrisvirgatae]ODP38424.1 ATP-dependent acyl-CoA ligase [Sphingomonas turrisvirgatae]
MTQGVEGAWLPGKLTTIVDVFERALDRRGPDFEFLDFSGTTYTLGALDIRSTQLAHGLRAAGALPGHCVTSVLDNCVEQILLLLACAKIGAIHVPLNTAYKGEYLRHQVSDSGAVVLVAEKEYVERMIQIEGGIPEARVLLVKGDMPAAAAVRLDVRPLSSAFVDTTEPTGFAVKPADLSMLIYTAGTTGPSKGCMISQNYACNMARQIGEAMLYNEDDVVWTPLPGFHMNQYTATILPALMAGCKAAVYPRFSVSRFWGEIERTGATVVQILSSMITLIADAADDPAAERYKGKLRLLAGTPIPEVYQNKWKDRFGVKYTAQICFGLTECALVTSVPIDVERPANSSGTHNDDFDVRIVDENDNEVPAGQSGEIIIRPKRPHVMFEGYWRRPEATAALLRNCWFHTGDIGMFDEQGWFYFVDRKKDYLRRRGENISSMEMEGVFRLHPQINEVAVHAVFADMEDDVKVTCTLVEDATLTEEELCRWSVDNLPYFAVPRFIEFRAALPKNPVGRVLKYELRDEGITQTTWDREKSQFELVKR